MKIVDVPQTGKLGLTVTYPGRNGLIRRTKVTPANPKTAAQMSIRSNLAAQARAYDQLTDTQQQAWITAAARIKSKPTLGQSGPLTGLQLFTKINCALLAIGDAPVSVPPAAAIFAPLPISSLELVNTAGDITLKLVTTDQPPESTMLWAAPPQNSGVRRAPGMVLLGTLGAPANGKVDITAVYTARFGAPAVGQRVFVAAQAVSNGWEGQRQEYSARVPSAA